MRRLGEVKSLWSGLGRASWEVLFTKSMRAWALRTDGRAEGRQEGGLGGRRMDAWRASGERLRSPELYPDTRSPLPGYPRSRLATHILPDLQRQSREPPLLRLDGIHPLSPRPLETVPPMQVDSAPAFPASNTALRLTHEQVTCKTNFSAMDVTLSYLIFHWFK